MLIYFYFRFVFSIYTGYDLCTGFARNQHLTLEFVSVGNYWVVLYVGMGVCSAAEESVVTEHTVDRCPAFRPMSPWMHAIDIILLRAFAIGIATILKIRHKL